MKQPIAIDILAHADFSGRLRHSRHNLGYAAFGTAVSAGHRKFSAIAVAGGKDGVLGEPFYPCGVCRQIMREFCANDMPVYIADGEDGILELTLADLLPYSFGKEYL